MNNIKPVPSPVFLSEEDFRHAVSSLPLISIDLCITDPSQRLLVGQRNNRPAQGWWFTPGGRVRKNEALDKAMARVAQGEVGLEESALHLLRPRMQLMGAWDHFYPDSAFSPDISTHYVNLPYWLPLSWAELEQLSLPLQDSDAQHNAWQWMTLDEVVNHDKVHQFAKPYAEWLQGKLRSPLDVPAPSRAAAG